MSFIRIKDPRKREELIKDLIETRKRIKDNFIARKVGESEYQTGLTKLFKPVTETQKATAKEITEAQKEATEKITQGLLPIKEALENPIVIPPIEAGESIEAKEPIPSIKLTEKEKTELGGIAVDSLQDTHGRKPTQSDLIPVDAKKGLYRFGNTPVEIKKNNLYIKDLGEINGTKELWNLIKSKDIPVINKDYKEKDLANYAYIMYHTNTTRQGFNRNNKRISGNDKMNKLIKPLVIAIEEGYIEEEIKKILTNKNEKPDEDEPTPGTSGTGLKFLSSDPNALIDRFDLLFSSKKAGHTGVKNEIVSILDELKRQGVININEYKKLNSIIKK